MMAQGCNLSGAFSSSLSASATAASSPSPLSEPDSLFAAATQKNATRKNGTMATATMATATAQFLSAGNPFGQPKSQKGLVQGLFASKSNSRKTSSQPAASKNSAVNNPFAIKTAQSQALFGYPTQPSSPSNPLGNNAKRVFLGGFSMPRTGTLGMTNRDQNYRCKEPVPKNRKLTSSPRTNGVKLRNEVMRSAIGRHSGPRVRSLQVGQNRGLGQLRSRQAVEMLARESTKHTKEISEFAFKYATKIWDHLEKENIRAPQWPAEIGDPNMRRSAEQLKEQYKRYREKVYGSLRKVELIDDPEVKRTLAEALPFKGICEDMCPEFEKVSRIAEFDVKLYEKDLQADGASMWPHPSLMVKKFGRSAAGQEAPLPMDVRSIAALRRTTNYLFDELLQCDANLPLMHNFLWDRTRAIRRDFTFHSQKTAGELKDMIYCLESIFRFHVVGLHLLSRNGFAAEDFEQKQEIEQLGATLLTLMETYDTCRELDVPVEAEHEFRAYWLLMNAHDSSIMSQVVSWSEEFWFSTDEIQIAMSLVECMIDVQLRFGPIQPRRPRAIANSSFGNYFAIVEDPTVSYTMACVAEVHFTYVRQRVLKTLVMSYSRVRDAPRYITAAEVNDMLRFDTVEEAEEFVKLHNLEFTTWVPEGKPRVSEPYLKLDQRRKKMPAPRIKQQFSGTLVERKRGGASLPYVIHHTIWEQPKEKDPVSAGSDESADSLFVAQDNQSRSVENSTPRQLGEAAEKWFFSSSDLPSENATPAKEYPLRNQTVPSPSLAIPPITAYRSPSPLTNFFAPTIPLAQPAQGIASIPWPSKRAAASAKAAKTPTPSPFFGTPATQSQAQTPSAFELLAQNKEQIAAQSSSSSTANPFATIDAPTASNSTFSWVQIHNGLQEAPESSTLAFPPSTPSPLIPSGTSNQSRPAPSQTTSATGGTTANPTTTPGFSAPNDLTSPSLVPSSAAGSAVSTIPAHFPKSLSSIFPGLQPALETTAVALTSTASAPQQTHGQPISNAPIFGPRQIVQEQASLTLVPHELSEPKSILNSPARASVSVRLPVETQAQALASTPPDSQQASWLTVIQPEKKARSPKDPLGAFAKWYVQGDGGLQDQFLAYMTESIVMAAWTQHQQEEEERRRLTEDEQSWVEALQHMEYRLSVKYFYQWRNKARTLSTKRILRQGKEQMRLFWEAKRRQEKEQKANADQVARKLQVEARRKAKEASLHISQLADEGLARMSMTAQQLLDSGIFAGLDDERDMIRKVVSQVIAADSFAPASRSERFIDGACASSPSLRSVKAPPSAISASSGTKRKSWKTQILEDKHATNKPRRTFSANSSINDATWNLKQSFGGRPTNFSKSPARSCKRSADDEFSETNRRLKRQHAGDQKTSHSQHWCMRKAGLVPSPNGNWVPEAIANIRSRDDAKPEDSSRALPIPSALHGRSYSDVTRMRARPATVMSSYSPSPESPASPQLPKVSSRGRRQNGSSPKRTRDVVEDGGYGEVGGDDMVGNCAKRRSEEITREETAQTVAETMRMLRELNAAMNRFDEDKLWMREQTEKIGLERQ